MQAGGLSSRINEVDIMAKKSTATVADIVKNAASVGRQAAVEDNGQEALFTEARKACIVPAAQGAKESAEKYSERCANWKVDDSVRDAFRAAYCETVKPRTIFPVNLYVIGETDGKCRDAKPGDSEAKVRGFTPAQAFLMDKAEYMALPGDSKKPDTVKGRVAKLRESMGDTSKKRFDSIVAEGIKQGARVEAGAESEEEKRAKNDKLPDVVLKWRKRGRTFCKAQGGDKVLSFDAAFGAFLADMIARRLVTEEEIKAATEAAAAVK